MKHLLLTTAVLFALNSTVSAQSYKENLAQGAATTKQNFLNVPFVKPKNWKTPYTTPGNWPIFENRGPLNRSPENKSSKVIVLGSGDPTPNPHRFGPALAVIVNAIPTSSTAEKAGGGRCQNQLCRRTHLTFRKSSHSKI